MQAVNTQYQQILNRSLNVIDIFLQTWLPKIYRRANEQSENEYAVVVYRAIVIRVIFRFRI